VHGEPHELTLEQEPHGFWIRKPFQVQPIINILDRGQNLVNSSSLAIKVELISSSKDVFILNDVLQLEAVRGVARFENLPCQQCDGSARSGIAIGFRGYNLKLRFTTVLGVAPVNSRAFDVGLGDPSTMALSGYPLYPQVAGLDFDHQPLITLLDVEGATVTWEPDKRMYIAATLNPRSDYIPKNLQGTTRVEVVRGKAQFTDLRHDYMATMYNLKFSLINPPPQITVRDIQSPLFHIVNGVAFQLSLGSSYGYPPANGTQPSGPVVGFPLTTQPVVLVLDRVRNMLWEAAVNVTVQVFTAENETVVDYGFLLNSTRTVVSCPLSGGRHDCSKCKPTKRLPAACGTAPFTDLRVDRGDENLVLRFSSPGLQSVDSQPLKVRLGEPYALFIEQEPLGFKYNTHLRIMPVIALKDRGNNTISDSTQYSQYQVRAHVCTQNYTNLQIACVDSKGSGWSATVLRGLARFTDIRIALVGSNFTIRFCSYPEGLRCAQSALFQVTEDPTQLLIQSQPGRGIPGLSLEHTPVVRIGDMLSSTTTWEPSYGLKVNCTLCALSSRLNVTEEEWKCAPDERWLELNALSACHYQTPDPLQKLLKGTSSQQVVEGLASFSDLRIDKRGTYKFRFTAGGLISIDSNPFVVDLGEASRLLILVESAGVYPGRPFETQPTVAIVDDGNNVVETDHDTRINATLWTQSGKDYQGLVSTHFIAPRHSPGYHNATQLTRFGVAIFEGLRIDNVGAYFIRYDTERFPSIDSRPIQVSIGIGVKLKIAVRPTGCCARASCNFMATQEPTCRTVPAISIVDLGENLVPWNEVRINATIFARHNAGGFGLQSFVATSDRSGTATFTDFGIDKPGHYTVKFRNISPYVWRTRHPDGSWTSKDYWVFSPVEANFSVSGRLARLFLEVNPFEIIPGDSMKQQPRLVMMDAGGFVVDHDLSTSVTAMVKKQSGDSPLVDLGGQQSRRATPTNVTNTSDPGGRVYFTDLRIDLACKCVRMHFSAPNSAGGSVTVKSLEFNVDVGPYHKIKVVQQPGGAVIGEPFGTQPRVALTDYGGNIVTDDSKTYVTASVFRGTIGDIRSDSKPTKQTLRLTAGQVQFVDLYTKIASACMQLEILAVGRQPGYSDPFTIMPGKPHRVEFLDDEARDRAPIKYGPAGPRPGLPLEVQPLLKVEDVQGNRIGTGGGIVGGVTASLLEGGNPAQCSYPIKHCLKGTTYAAFNHFDGIARFTNLQIDRANLFGSYSILFESNDLEVNRPIEVGNYTKIYYSLLPVESNRDLIVTAGVLTVGLEVVVEPDKFVPGLPMKVLPVIGVVDAGGNVVKSSLPQTVSCSIRAENFWWLDLIGDRIILARNGLEAFKDLGINTTARKVTLTFDNLFLGKVDSFSFDVSGPLARLALLSQSTLSTAGEVFPIDAVLRGFDHEELIVTTFGHPPFPIDTPDVITVAINESSAYCKVIQINETTIVQGGFAFNATSNQTIDNRVNTTTNTTTLCFEDTRLQGKNISTYSYGLANFTDLRIDQTGTYYLRFTVPVLNISVVSSPIVIVNARASELRLITQVRAPKEATYPVKRAPEAMLLDRFGNRVLDKDFRVFATFFQGLTEVPAKYVQGILAVNTSMGIASFNNSALGLTLAGNDFSIRLSVEGLPSIWTAPFEVRVGAPYKLRSLSSPSRFFEKEPFSDEPSFELLDRGGNLIKSSDNVTISLWNMQGCENCTNITNTTNNITRMQTTCTNTQDIFEREYDSNRLPCGHRVSGLHIVQPFCMAEYLNDTIVSFCKDLLEGDDFSGEINRHIKEGNFPIKWSFMSTLDMSIEAYLHNRSYNSTIFNSTTLSLINSTTNATYEKNFTTSRTVSMPYNATTLLKLQLKYQIQLVTNGTVVRSFCTSEVRGLQPHLYNETSWGSVDKHTVRELLYRSNMSLANLTAQAGALGLRWVGLGSSSPSYGTEISNEALAAALGQKTGFTPAEVAEFKLPVLSRENYIRAVNDKYYAPAADLPQISVHGCIKYNFTRLLDAGKGDFRRVALMSPSPGTESLKLRITFKDKEYKLAYSVSTLHVAPGYRQYRQDLKEIPPPVTATAPSTTASPLTTPAPLLNQSNGTNATTAADYAMAAPASSISRNVADFSKYHIIIESKSFQVSGPPIALRHLTLPLGVSTGGTPFSVQPTFQIIDAGGRLVTKVFDLVVTATLITDTGGRIQVCNAAKPFRCSAPTSVCARDETFCPKLLGQAQTKPKMGFVAFSDLAISTCNDPKVPYDLCVIGNYRVQFTAVSWGQSLQDIGGIMTPPTNVSLQGVLSGVVDNFIGPPAVLTMPIEPKGGSRAGDPLVGQPTVVTKDAGGNRIISSPVRLTAILSVFNHSVPLEDYSQDGIQGTRSVTATFDGKFVWTDLRIDKSSDKFVLNIVQFDAVPGFPRAPTITSGLLFIKAGYGVSLKLEIQPNRGVGGEPFLDQPKVVVLDKRGNAVIFEQYNVSVRLADESLAIGGTLSKAKMSAGQPVPDQSASRFIATTVAGVAQFAGLVIDKAGTCYRLVFSATGLSDAVSESFDILSGKVRQLLIINQPAGPVPGQVLKTQPLIHLSDWGRNPVRYLRDRVQVSLIPGNLTANNTEPLKLYGTTLMQATDGILEFTDLMIVHAGNGFRLSFARYVGGMNPVESIPLDLAVGAPHRLRVNIQPSGPVSGSFMQTQPQVQVEDAGGNRVEMGSHIVTANLFQLGLPSPVTLRGPECTAYECAGQIGVNRTESIRAVCPTCVVTNTSAGRDLVTTVASAKGISQFTALAIGAVGKHYTIRFTSSLLLGAESHLPMSVAVGIPVRLVFEQAPSGYLADTPFRFQPIIKLVDSGGNLISDRSGLVTVTLEHAKGSRLLPVGNTRVTMIRGRAIFVKLKVDKSGLGFTMLFTGNMCANTSVAANVQCQPARSLPFNVTGPRTHVENKVQVENSIVYKLLQPQPQVHLLDAENRTVGWDSGRGRICNLVSASQSLVRNLCTIALNRL